MRIIICKCVHADRDSIIIIMALNLYAFEHRSISKSITQQNLTMYGI